MATATAFCPSNTPFHQHALLSPRSQYSNAVSRRTTLSSSPSAFSSTVPLTSTDSLTRIKITTSDENNNNEQHQFDETSISDDDDILYIANDHEDIDNISTCNNDDDDQIVDNTNVEEYLSCVGLRLKTKKPKPAIPCFPPLKNLKRKDLLRPICLLPIPKYSEHIRKVIYMHLPLLKHLSITCDIEFFCSTDENAKAQSLLPRTNVLTRALSTLNKTPKKTKLLPKGDLINMATTALRKSTCQISKNKHMRSILECNVILDRLEQSAIDQIMQNTYDEDNQIQTKISSSSMHKNDSETDQLPIITNCETLQTPRSNVKTMRKRQKSTEENDKSKQLKSIENTSTVTENPTHSSLSDYERIYLKCFVCSKCQFIDAQVTDSDVLHTHWNEHAARLSLNIYDSEIDSIVTRVVEFFHSPRKHLLEGKIKTIYIYNSKEIRSTTTTTLSTEDSYIVID